MAELKPMEVIMKIDFVASNGLEVVAHAERVSELVRCKDCKHYNPYENDGADGVCKLHTWLVTDEDFCSDAKSKPADSCGASMRGESNG